MVFGTPTIGMPFLQEPARDPERAVAADRDQRVAADLAEPAHDLVGDVDGDLLAVAFAVMNSNGWPLLTVPRMVPPRWAMPRDLVARQVDQAVVRRLQQAVVAAADAGHLPAAPQPGQRDGANDRVQARRVAPAGVDQDVHALKAISWLHAECKRGVWKQSTPSPRITWKRADLAARARSRPGPEILSTAPRGPRRWAERAPAPVAPCVSRGQSVGVLGTVAFALAVAGCGGSGGMLTGRAGTSGGAAGAGAGVGSGAAGLGGSGAAGIGGAGAATPWGNVVLHDANNYAATASLSIPVVQTAPGADLRICWSSLAKDLRCHDLVPTIDIDNVAFMQIPNVTRNEVAGELLVGQLEQTCSASTATITSIRRRRRRARACRSSSWVNMWSPPPITSRIRTRRICSCSRPAPRR